MNQIYVDQEIDEASKQNRAEFPKRINKFNRLMTDAILKTTSGRIDLAKDAINLFDDDQKVLLMIVIDSVLDQVMQDQENELRKGFNDFVYLCSLDKYDRGKGH